MAQLVQNRRDLIERVRLADALPLRTPFTVYVDPASACNFSCDFCYHSIDNATLRKIQFKKKIMTMELFQLAMDRIAEFPDKLKMLSLFMKGEPLLNPRLPEMVSLAKENDITEKVYITTNGSLLSPTLNRQLIDAGVDEMLISIEGVDSEDYKRITGVDVDFDMLVENIRDLFVHKGETKVFVKTVTYQEDEKKCARFHELFDDISDLAYVEKVVPVFDRVRYNTMNLDKSQLLKFGKPIAVCTRPFFNLCVHANGDIGPCLADYVPEIPFGNITADSLYDVWHGKKMRDFRLMHLRGQRYSHPRCGTCISPDYDSQESDLLDDDAPRLAWLYE